jgi:hypothetical protein
MSRENIDKQTNRQRAASRREERQGKKEERDIEFSQMI